jgi:hypothetical protein
MKAISEILFRVYLALVSLVTVFILLVSSGILLDHGLRAYVFPKADAPDYWRQCSWEDPYFEFGPEEEKTELTEEERKDRCDRINEQELENYKVQQARSSVSALSYLLISLPIFLVHFLAFYKDAKKSRSKK